MSGSFWVLPGAIASGVCVLGTFLRVCLLATFPALSGVSVSGYLPSGVSASFSGSFLPGFGCSGCFRVLLGPSGCFRVCLGASGCCGVPVSPGTHERNYLKTPNVVKSGRGRVVKYRASLPEGRGFNSE